MNTIISIIVWLALGALAGWLAGVIMHDQGSLVRNIVVGILGSIIGGFLAGLIGFGSTNIIGSILIAVLGAVVLLAIVRLVTKK